MNNSQASQLQTRKRSFSVEFLVHAKRLLQNKWGIAMGVGILALILGAVGFNGFYLFSLPGIIYNLNSSYPQELMEATVISESWNQLMSPDVRRLYAIMLLVVLLIAAVFRLFVSAPVKVGYARFNLDLMDGQPELQVGTLFSAYRTCLWKSAGTSLILGVPKCILLLVMCIPYTFGIMMIMVGCFTAIFGHPTVPGSFVITFLALLPIALLSVVLLILIHCLYCPVPYIFAEQPQVGMLEAMRLSRRLMKGNKWRLICLECNFIGWVALAVFTGGLANLYLVPYRSAAIAAFYREITRRDEVGQSELSGENPDACFA